jgi:HlyD family secretion protein
MGKVNGRRARRWWIAGLAILLAGGLWAARPTAPAKEEKDKVKTAKAETGSVQVRVTEVGSVEPQVKVDVKSVLSGKVVELLVREGDRVKRGQVLARVEPDVNQARDLSQVKNAVHEAAITLSETKANHERDRELLAQGLLSQKDNLESETRYRAALAAHESAAEKFRIVQESGVPITAGADTRQRLNVAAPMDGVVIRRSVELGDTVTSGVSSFNAGTVLMTVADVGTMIIKAGINEVDIGKVRLEQPVKVSLDAYPKARFAGIIKRIAPAARLEDKVKVFEVEIAIDRQGAELRTGMTANVDVMGERKDRVLTVPVEALFRKDDAELVYIKKVGTPHAAESPGLLSRVFAGGKKDDPAAKLDDKDKWKEKFEVRTVETGLSSFDKVEVVSGLKPGDEVAVEDPTKPREKKERE